MCHIVMLNATSAEPAACRTKRALAEELASSLTKATRRPLGRRGVGSVAPLGTGPHTPSKSPTSERGKGEEKGANKRRKGDREENAAHSRPQPAVAVVRPDLRREREEKAAHPRPQPAIDVVLPDLI